MPSAIYRFRTSSFNFRTGLALIAAAGAAAVVQVNAHAWITGLSIFGAVALAFSIACFLARYSLELDVQQGHVKDTAGFWPAARTRYEYVADFSGLEITFYASTRSSHFTLWLIANDGRRISLEDRSYWPKLNERAQEISRATGWPVNDVSNGPNSISSLLGL